MLGWLREAGGIGGRWGGACLRIDVVLLEGLEANEAM